MVVWPTDSKLSRALSSKRSTALDVDIGIRPILFRRFGLRYARTVSRVMEENADSSEQCEGDYTNQSRADGCTNIHLYRVNFEVNNLKPFACLAFPQTTYRKTLGKQPIFGDELVTSFCRSTFQPAFSARTVLAHGADTQLTHVTASQGIVSRKRNRFGSVSE